MKGCRWPTALRVGAGSFFVLAGLAKATRSPLPGIPAGIDGFASYLSAAGLPFPDLGARVVCALEVAAGLGLAVGAASPRLRQATRWLAGPLAAEMTVAMAFVGIPTAMGRPVMLGGRPVTNERYRLPLELGLFLGMAYLARRSLRPE